MEKGQAAMEFLMTYGWAILVVLIAIGALAYFGVLNPSRFLPASCTLIPGLSCADFLATDGVAPAVDTITLVIQNGMGKDWSTFKVKIGAPCTSAEVSAVGGLVDGEKETLALSCSTTNAFAAKERVKADITITYQETGGLSHTATGQLIVQAQ